MKSRPTAVYYSDAALGERIEGAFLRVESVEGDIFHNRTPSPTDIEQTTIGDCYFLAALKTIVRRNPSAIYEMIQDVGNNRVAVRFYVRSDSTDLPIEMWYEIDKSIVIHLVNKIGFGHKSPWVYLIEKAYTLHRLRDEKFIVDYRINSWKETNKEDNWKHLSDDEIYQKSINEIKSDSHFFDYKQVLSGGFSNTVYEALLGCSAARYKIPHPNLSLMKLISLSSYLIDADILDDIFKDKKKCYLLLLKHLSLFSKDEEKIRQQAAEALVKKIAFNQATQLEVMNYFQTYFPGLDEITYNAIELAVIQGVNIKLGEKRYSRESASLYNLIHEKLEAGDLVCLETINKGNKKEMTGLSPEHMYEVINCYQKNGRCMFVLSNPWGRKIRDYQLLNENSDFLIPKTKQFFWVTSKNNEDVNNDKIKDNITNIAITNKNYLPSIVFQQPATFELDLNDCMSLFSHANFANINKSKKEYLDLIKGLEDSIEIDKNDFLNNTDENILTKTADKIFRSREKQQNILAHLEWLEEMTISKPFANENDYEVKLNNNRMRQ